MFTINENNRQRLIENYVERITDDLTPAEIRGLLIDYIYDDKSRMSNVALFAEINEVYPDILEE